MDKKLSLAELSEPARAEALQRYQALQPYLEGQATLKAVAATENIPYGTVRRWVRLYRREGLTGLAPQPRTDRDQRCLPAELQGQKVAKLSPGARSP